MEKIFRKTDYIKKFLILLAIFALSLPAGCSTEKIEPEPAKDEDERENEMNDPTGLTYLALGDSYTIGEGVTESQRYPVQLRDSLVKAGINMAPVGIIARTGWTTDELSAAIDNAQLNPPFNMVSLLIGVNNQYRGRNPENYRSEFIQLLDRAIGFAGNRPDRVIVISIPDWGITPFGSGSDRNKIAREIDLFNEINYQESLKKGVAYINVTPISREALNRPELLAPDGLHPSGLMYSMWVEKLFPIALEILQNE